MRVALLSLDDAPGGAHSNRRRKAGASQLERQVDIALAAGCEQILLSTRIQDDTAVAAQHLAEQGGARFRIISQGRQLLGALRKQDELVVLSEGLTFSDQICLPYLSSGSVIMTLPAQMGVQAGFERLDHDLAWAGVLVIPGGVLEHLDGLPVDFEPVSTLLRAARSARIIESRLPPELIAEGKWSLSLAETKAAVGLGLQPDLSEEKSSILAQRALQPVVRWLIDYESWQVIALLAGLLMCVCAAILGYLGQFSIGMVSLAAAIFAMRCWAQTKQLASASMFSSSRNNRLTQWLPQLPDAIGLWLLLLALTEGYSLESAAYIAFLTWATWSLARAGNTRVNAIFRDRELLWVGLAIGGMLGQWFAGAAAVTAISLASILFLRRKPAAITVA